MIADEFEQPGIEISRTSREEEKSWVTRWIALEIHVDRNTAISSSASTGAGSNVVGIKAIITQVSKAVSHQRGSSRPDKGRASLRVVRSLLVHKGLVVASGDRSGGSDRGKVRVRKKISHVIGASGVGRS